jgi:hypothetical protein
LSNKFISESGDEFVRPGDPLPLVTAGRLLKALGVSDAPQQEQREAVAEWLGSHESNAILLASLRAAGLVTL